MSDFLKLRYVYIWILLLYVNSKGIKIIVFVKSCIYLSFLTESLLILVFFILFALKLAKEIEIKQKHNKKN